MKNERKSDTIRVFLDSKNAITITQWSLNRSDFKLKNYTLLIHCIVSIANYDPLCANLFFNTTRYYV